MDGVLIKAVDKETKPDLQVTLVRVLAHGRLEAVLTVQVGYLFVCTLVH